MQYEVQLNRTGRQKVTFDGELLFEVTNRERRSSRYWRLEGYINHTLKGCYAVGIGHITTWSRPERHWYDAHDDVKTKEGVIKWFRDRIPPATPPEDTAETLVRDWDQEREAYIKLLDEVEQLLGGLAPISEQPHHQEQ